MKRFGVFIFLVTFLTGCDNKPTQEGNPSKAGPVKLAEQPDVLCENKPFSDRELDLAALDVIFRRVDDKPATTAEIAAARTKLASVKAWALKIDNPKIRNAYMKWLDSYADDYDEAEKKLKEGKDPRKTAQDEEYAAQQARAAELAKCLPVPPKF